MELQKSTQMSVKNMFICDVLLNFFVSVYVDATLALLDNHTSSLKRMYI